MHTRHAGTGVKEMPVFGRFPPVIPKIKRGPLTRKIRAEWKRVEPYQLPILLLVGGALFFTLSFLAFILSFPTDKVSAVLTLPPTPLPLGEGASEMLVSSSGVVSLRSARVVEIQGTTLIVSAAWGSADFRWTIRTNPIAYETRTFGTRFLDFSGEKISPKSLRVGDLVTISGTIDASATIPTLDAGTVRSLKE